MGCSQTTSIDTISVFDVEKIISLHKPVIIDGRDSAKFCKGHLPGAIVIDAYSETVDVSINSLSKEDTFLIYCTTTNRASIIIEKMKNKGFKQIYFMNEGFVVYQENNLKNETCTLVND